MDILPIAVSVLCGSTAGAVGMALVVGDRVQRFRHTITARDKTIDAHVARIRDADTERERQTDRCVQLRQELKTKERIIDGLARKLAEVEPDAKLGRKTREQRQRALDAANAANRARKGSKKRCNVAPIRKPVRITAPKKPTRKSAVAG